MEGLMPETYASYARSVFAALSRPGPVTRASDVADAIWNAVHDTSARLRFAAGEDAVALSRLR